MRMLLLLLFSTSARPKCPRVFTYSLPPSLQDYDFERLMRLPLETQLRRVFGPLAPLPPTILKGVLHNESQRLLRDATLRSVNQYSLALILLHRLATAPAACRTTNASEADVFFIPVFAKPKRLNGWASRCDQGGNSSLLLKHLPHLNEENACRHFMVVSKAHYSAHNCEWWRRPTGLLARVTRFAYSHALPESTVAMHGRWRRILLRPGCAGAQARTRSCLERLNEMCSGTQAACWAHAEDFYQIALRRRDASEYPNLHSVPYPSGMHWSDRRDVRAANRVRSGPLMLFVGNLLHGDRGVREQIRLQCKEADPSICQRAPAPHMGSWLDRVGWTNIVRDADGDLGGISKNDWLLLRKATAVFCLEPGGDTPFRKSISDSIAFGCIPVLFSNLTDAVAPWFWGDWKADARVLVPRDDFAAGRIDLPRLLGSIPESRVREMQRTLWRFGRRFQYSIGHDPDDAVSVMLRGVAAGGGGGCAHEGAP